MGMIVPTRPMMMMRMPIDHIRLRRATAVANCRAISHFQLNRRMVNPKMIAQLMVDPLQHSLALHQRHLDHLHMAGQRMGLRRKAPNVQIMHIHNPLHLRHRRPYVP